MSSFVISKDQYAKAAGVVAGLFGSDRDMFFYDYTAGRRATEKDFLDRFLECYEMNAASVIEQYNDPEMEVTPANDKECKAAFLEGLKKGKSAYINDRRRAVSELMHFFRSALYQTEKEAYYFKMMMLFNRLSVLMCERWILPRAESWGTLEL